jgi:hypothetical protein
MTTYYAAHDDSAIYYISTNRDTILDNAAREAGYADHAQLIEDGNRGYDVAEIEGDLAEEILTGGTDPTQAFELKDGIITKWD